MDTLGGVLALQGKKPLVNEGFWSLVAFADTAGAHEVKALYKDGQPETVHNIHILWACWAYLAKNRQVYKTTADVTQEVDNFYEFLSNISTADIEAGIEWERQASEQVEACLWKEIEIKGKFFRVFNSDGVFCNAGYYSPVKNRIADCVITFNNKLKNITISFPADCEFNACLIMQEIFGKEAGGHRNIAGTPRGVEYSLRDIDKVLEYFII